MWSQEVGILATGGSAEAGGNGGNVITTYAFVIIRSCSHGFVCHWENELWECVAHDDGYLCRIVNVCESCMFLRFLRQLDFPEGEHILSCKIPWHFKNRE